jgi:predicted DNA-binding WGR domain protein
MLTMLCRRDPQRNLARFYALSVQPNLFGPDP